MKYFRKSTLIILSFVLIFLPVGYLAAQGPGSRELVILFTHDLHSYFLPHRVLTEEGQSEERGGFAKLAYIIKEQRIYHGNKAIRLDAGDFSMGTLFHTSFMSEASELLLMGQMGYDVTTFGNHDFDFGTAGLAQMLRAAKAKGKALPGIVASNIEVDKKTEEGKALQQAFEEYPVTPYKLLERNKVRIGIFGLLGKDAASDTPFAKSIRFTDQVSAAKRVVKILLKKEKVDMIICLSHSGTYRAAPGEKDKIISEDELLAQKVPEIDVIVSGHTHTVLAKPIKIGKTVIVSSGRYGEHLGILRVYHTKNKPLRVASYELRNITSGIPDDRLVSEAVQEYKDIVNARFLAPYRLSFEQVIAESDFNMETIVSAYEKPREMGLGNLIADSYRYAVQKAEGPKYEYVHVSFEPLGLIRESFQKGRITTEDVFQVLSLGIGKDGIPGYPLMAFYVTGKELKDILEVEASVAPLKKIGAHLQVSGVKFTFNPHRILFDRVTQVSVRNERGDYEPLEYEKLYRICSNMYAAGMIGYVSKVTYRLLSITPKDKDGNKISELKQAIIYMDRSAGKERELKQWLALLQYLRSLPDTNRNGIPNIPAKYSAPEGRYKAVPDKSLKGRFSGGNFITTGALLVGLIILCALLLLGWLTVAKIRKLTARK
ncbi:MAG TPA: bifunctional UDP-sugar hydrolase/5'-nucleotidase [Smithellaceae bacterium]|nr:bifunctional UDP-sugar hydrolase/5'-nucleotidase [Smithellaceae bacterium]HRS89575.1 bifunctional UDP-sugar hydrolase/5'-nucleotidase [Smithellaceae bacterium]HRV26364.1 bifunctional UDP-sugar hydrolase/5'-nucleotidase [Smithellaceae bacterium]